MTPEPGNVASGRSGIRQGEFDWFTRVQLDASQCLGKGGEHAKVSAARALPNQNTGTHAGQSPTGPLCGRPIDLGKVEILLIPQRSGLLIETTQAPQPCAADLPLEELLAILAGEPRAVCRRLQEGYDRAHCATCHVGAERYAG